MRTRVWIVSALASIGTLGAGLFSWMLPLAQSHATAQSASDATNTAAEAASSSESSPSASSSTSASAAATPSPSATASSVSGTFTGQAVQTREGTVQVQVTIAGGVITEITALQLPSGSAKHDQINATAEPILRSEALAAQSANIDIVSGATYTSEGYIQSLQSALDQAS